MELITAAGSFLVFHFASHPKSRFNKKLPNKKIASRVQIFPRINIEAKNRIFHFHHWMIFTPLYLFTQHTGNGLFNSGLIRGILLGGIIQGLLYADRFKLIFNVNDYKKVKRSSYNVSFLKKLI